MGFTHILAVHMQEKTLAVLERLTEMKPLPARQARSWFEAKIYRITTVLRWMGGSLFLLMLLLVAPVFVWPTLRASEGLALAVKSISALSISCALLWLILDMLPGLVTLALARRYAMRRQLLDAAHDFAHVEALVHEGMTALQLAKQWIVIEMDRATARITLMFGSPDKMAIVSLAALGWSAWKESHSLGADWMGIAVQFVLALLGGAAIGTLFAKDRLAQLAYQRDLLTMAIFQLESVKTDQWQATASNLTTAIASGVDPLLAGTFAETEYPGVSSLGLSRPRASEQPPQK